MDLVENPFATGTRRMAESPYSDPSIERDGSRVANTLMDAAAREAGADPLKDMQGELTARKTQLGYAKQATEQLRDKFLETEGADLFQRDPLTNKIAEAPDKTYIPKLGKEIERLRAKTTQKVGIIRGALTSAVAGEPTDEAREAETQLAQLEPIYKAKLGKYQRIQAQLDRIKAAHDENEMQLGAVATRRLERSGVFGTPGDTKLLQDSSAAEQGSHNPQVVGSTPTPAPTIAPGQPTAQTQPDAAIPAPAPVVPPLALVQMHKQMKDAEAIMAMETTNPKLKEALRQKRERLAMAFGKGMATLPANLQQRVVDITRDPTTMEYVKNFAGQIASGMAGTTVDTGESIARNAMKLSGMDDSAEPQKRLAEFAQAMREEGDAWGRANIPKEVQDKLRDSFSGTVAQGIGSTLGFIAPTAIIGKIGRLAGLGEKAVRGLMTASVGLTGAASESNNFRREAENGLKQQLDHGEITPQEYRSTLGMAEVFGAATGSTEAFTGIGRMAERIGRGQAGKSFLRKLFDIAGRDGNTAAVKWLKGAGQKAIVDTASEMLEESVQEFGQNAGENYFASQTFDKGREVLGGASESAGAAAISTMIVSSFTQALSLPGQTRRYKGLGEAVNRGAETRRQANAKDQPAAVDPKANTPEGIKAREGLMQERKGLQEQLSKLTPEQSEEAARISARIGEIDKLTRQAGPEPAAQTPAADETAPAPARPKTVNRFIFTDAAGQTAAVVAEGIGAAQKQLPNGFQPDNTKTRSETVPVAPAEFIGIEGEGTPKAFESYRLTEDVPALGLTIGASVSRQRLEEAGYHVPAPPSQPAQPTPGPTNGRGSFRTKNPQGQAVTAGKPSNGQTQNLPTEIGQTPQTGGAQPAPAKTGAGKPPLIAAGENTPANFHAGVSQAVGVKAGSKAHKFLADFSRRLHRAAPAAFEMMEVRVLNQAEWDADARVGAFTPDSAGAFDPGSNTLYINSDKSKGNAVMNTIVHEAGHFAEKYALGDEFTQKQWEMLKPEQRAEAAKQYLQREMTAEEVAAFGDGKGDTRARREWVAMQFARVVRGETEGMDTGVKARLDRFLRDVRELVNKWIGDGKLTTKELDAKIIAMLGYDRNGGTTAANKPAGPKTDTVAAPAAPVAGQEPPTPAHADRPAQNNAASGGAAAESQGETPAKSDPKIKSSRTKIAAQRKLIAGLTERATNLAKHNPKRAKPIFERIAKEQEQLGRLIEAKRDGKSPQVGNLPTGEPDLLTDIAEHVGRLQTQRKEGQENVGELDGAGETLNAGAARLLRGGTEGTAWDEAVDIINEATGRNFQSIGEFQQAIVNAVKQRRQMGTVYAAEQRGQAVEAAALNNDRNRNKPDRATPIEKIGVGGKFDILGEKFSVVDTEEGPGGMVLYIIQDGHRFAVPEGTMFYPDRGTLKKAKNERQKEKPSLEADPFFGEEKPAESAQPQPPDGLSREEKTEIEALENDLKDRTEKRDRPLGTPAIKARPDKLTIRRVAHATGDIIESTVDPAQSERIAAESRAAVHKYEALLRCVTQ